MIRAGQTSLSLAPFGCLCSVKFSRISSMVHSFSLFVLILVSSQPCIEPLPRQVEVRMHCLRRFSLRVIMSNRLSSDLLFHTTLRLESPHHYARRRFKNPRAAAPEPNSQNAAGSGTGATLSGTTTLLPNVPSVPLYAYVPPLVLPSLA